MSTPHTETQRHKSEPTKAHQRQPATSITGEELEARVNDWVDSRRRQLAERTPEQNSRLLQKLLAGVLLAVIVVLAGVYAFTNQTFEQTYADNDARISELEQQLVDDPDPGAELDADAIAQLHDDAAALAESVTEDQRRFISLYEELNPEITADDGDGAPGEVMGSIIEHRRAAADHWEDDTLIVDDELAYAFTTVSYFDDDEIDPRFPWYIRFDGAAASSADVYDWHVDAVHPLLENPNTARVLWRCTETDGTTLAWAQALYSADSGQFSMLRLSQTAVGQQHQQQLGDEPADDERGEAG